MMPSDRNAYAGFWVRLIAHLVDAFIIIVVLSILWPNPDIDITSAAFEQQILDYLVQSFRVVLQSVLISWLYFSISESSSWQATLGKKMFELKVVGSAGERISFGQATGRYFASALSALSLGIGYLMIVWTSKRQGLHDYMAGTLVIKDR